jgi:hypothetical protein
MMYQQAYDTNLQSAVIVWMDTTSGFFAQPRVPPLCGPVAAVAPASSGMTEVNAPCPDPGTKLKTLSVGTDCSGMEAPIQALQNMQIPIDHVFSCDNCPKVVSTIKANHQPKQFFNDIKERNNEVAGRFSMPIVQYCRQATRLR